MCQRIVDFLKHCVFAGLPVLQPEDKDDELVPWLPLLSDLAYGDVRKLSGNGQSLPCCGISLLLSLIVLRSALSSCLVVSGSIVTCSLERYRVSRLVRTLVVHVTRAHPGRRSWSLQPQLQGPRQIDSPCTTSAHEFHRQVALGGAGLTRLHTVAGVALCACVPTRCRQVVLGGAGLCNASVLHATGTSVWTLSVCVCVCVCVCVRAACTKDVALTDAFRIGSLSVARVDALRIGSLSVVLIDALWVGSLSVVLIDALWVGSLSIVGTND